MTATPPATATFLKQDATARGNWIGTDANQVSNVMGTVEVGSADSQANLPSASTFAAAVSEDTPRRRVLRPAVERGVHDVRLFGRAEHKPRLTGWSLIKAARQS
jgi:hypothetical protein